MHDVSDLGTYVPDSATAALPAGIMTSMLTASHLDHARDVAAIHGAFAVPNYSGAHPETCGAVASADSLGSFSVSAILATTHTHA